jgi:hypothetical protein
MTSGTDAVTGIYTSNSTYADVYFNTIRIHKGNTTVGSNAYSNVGGSNIKVKNNNFVNFGAGRAYWNSTTNAIQESDYNNLFSAGNYLAYWNNSDRTGLESLRLKSGMDVNSLNINPWFLGDEEPDINSSFIDGKGIAISGISTDYSNNTRLDPPDIGAVEFTPTVGPIEAGTYTIGGDSPSYPSIVEGLTDLQQRGISGPIVFDIRSGDYTEHPGVVYKISGTSATNTIVLKSETGIPEDVRILQQTGNVGQAYNVMTLRGVDYFTLRDLTISALGTIGGRPLSVDRTFTNVNIINNILTSGNTVSSSVVVNGIFDSTVVKNNVISNGYSGLYFFGDASIFGSNNSVIGNKITGSKYQGINMKYQYAPEIIGNEITNTLYGGFEAIRCELCSDKMVVSRNRINNDNSDFGINLLDCDATSPNFGLVSNNMIHVGGTSTSNGISLDNCTRTFLYSNSIHITSTHTYLGRCIYTASNNSEIEIINNVLVNSGNAYVLQIDDLNDVPLMDYNNYYAVGSLVRNINDYYNVLSDWQTASGKDLNSVSVEPMFVSKSDLHTLQLAFHEAGTSLAEVTVDIDGNPRDPSKPDLGASEFSCVTPVFNVYVTPVCLGDTTMIIDSTEFIAPGSTRGWDMTGDFVADVYTENQYDTIMWVFDQPGESSVSYIVQQIAGCNNFITLDASVIPEPILEIETQGAYCDLNDGWAKVSVPNLEGPFFYDWSNGSTDSVANNLALDSYTVAVSNATGCTASAEVVIGEAIELTLTPLSTSTCGNSDGSAMVSALGGVAPYTYSWSNGNTTANNDTLSPGPHYVDVFDSDGCSAKGYITIESEAGPQVTLASSNDIDCNGERSGSIDISVSGGAAPYSILWTNGKTSEDIDNLAAGVYNVVVRDADDCLGAGSFQVIQSAQLSISPRITPANCETSDGSVVAIVSGGSKPYKYSWSTGGVFSIEEGLAAGVYSVTVQDAKGCEEVEPVIVSNLNAPIVSIDDVQGIGCTIIDNGSISASVSPGNPFYTYSWSSGQNTPAISNLTAGNYVLTVTNSEGCAGINQAVIETEQPAMNPICIVSVDTLTGKNMLIWVKEYTDDVSHYNIYRESSVKGDYQLIDTVSVENESVYIDVVADPAIRSWRYKISVVDVCGNESELSPHHKTIHLTMGLGLDETVNLIWDHYEGFSFTTYKIWRYDANSGWVNITDLASNDKSFNSYTDTEPPKEDLTYFVEVLHAGGCESTEKKPSRLNSSRSNRRSSKKSTTNPGSIEGAMNISVFSIYPNPGQGVFKIDLEQEGLSEACIKVFDVSGKMLSVIEYSDIRGRLESEIDLSEYTDGIYQVQIVAGNTLLHRILIKE